MIRRAVLILMLLSVCGVGAARAALTGADIDTSGALLYKRSDLQSIRLKYGCKYRGNNVENTAAPLYKLWLLIKQQYTTYRADPAGQWPSRTAGVVWYAVLTEDPIALQDARNFIEAYYNGSVTNGGAGWPYNRSGGSQPPCASGTKTMTDGEDTGIGGGVSVFAFAVSAMDLYLTPADRIKYRRIFHYAHPPKDCVTDYGDTQGEFYKSTSQKGSFNFAAALGDSASLGELAELDGLHDFFAGTGTPAAGCLPCLKALDVRGPVDQYDGRRYACMALNHWMWRTNTKVSDAFTNERDYFADAGLSWALRLRPSISSASGVMSVHWEPSSSKFNSSDKEPLALLSYAGACGNDKATSLAYHLINDLGYPGTNGNSLASRCILPGIWLPATNPDPTGWQTLERETLHEGPNWYLYREKYQLAAAGPYDGVRAQFFMNTASLKAFANSGSYQVEYGDMNMAWRGFFREHTDFDYHFQTVVAKTWGYNCMVLTNTNDPLGEGFTTMIRDANTDSDCTDQPSPRVPKFGNQTNGDQTEIPGLEACSGALTSNNPEHKGNTIEETVHSRFASMCADFAPCYTSTSQTGVYRWVFFGKPEWYGANRAFWIVVDQAKPKTGTTTMTSYVHTPNALHTDGAITRLAGAGNVVADSIVVDWDGNAFYGDNAQGGRYRTTNSTRMWTANAPGQMVLFPLYAKDGAGTNGYVEIVGGPNADREHWTNNWQFCTNTWRQTKTSYEFYALNPDSTVWWNWTPGTPASNATCATCQPGLSGWRPYRGGSGSEYFVLSAADINQRLTGSPANGPGEASSDYSFRYKLDTPNVGTWSTMVYGGWVGPSTVTPNQLPIMRATVSSTAICAEITDGAYGYAVVRPSPNVGSVRPTTLTWTNPISTGEDADYAATFLLPSTTYALDHDGAFVQTVSTDSEGAATWVHTANSVGTFRLTQIGVQSGACCVDGDCTITTEQACLGEYQGDGTVCSPNPCPQLGACCILNACTITTQAACGGTWFGSGSTCSPSPCPQATGACCREDGTCGIRTQAQCEVGPGNVYLGDNTDCSPNPCPQPQGTCCLADGSCVQIEQANCTGIWVGFDIPCSPGLCPQPTGACCYIDGSCLATVEEACGGTYQGDGTICSPNPCPSPPTGACCTDAGGCSVTTQAACVGVGTWQGSGTNCTPNLCPAATGACCYEDGSCTVETAAVCPALSGTYMGDGTDCTTTPCPVPVGGCCDPATNDCTIETEAHCTSLGYTYFGDDSICNQSCADPSVYGACCALYGIPAGIDGSNGQCYILTESNCAVLNGTYQGDNTLCEPNPCAAPSRNGGRGDERPGAGLGRTRWLGR